MTIHEVLTWLKARGLASSRASLYRLIRQEGFPSPVLHGRKGDWSTDEITRWDDDRRLRGINLVQVPGIALARSERYPFAETVIRWAEMQPGPTDELVRDVCARLGTARAVDVMTIYASRGGLPDLAQS